MSDTISRFYRRWIVANGWCEAAGLGTTFVAGLVAGPRLEQLSGAGAVIATAGAAIVLGIVLEGLIVGIAQASVLRMRLPQLSARSWVVATMIGAGLAWTVGMIPSSVMALMNDAADAGTPPDPGPLVVYPAAAALGVLTGPILGCAQWTVLKRHVRHAHRWLWANATAWAVGMPVIFLGMDFVPWTATVPELVLSIYAVCGVAGLAVGAVHGRFLDTLTRPAQLG